MNVEYSNRIYDKFECVLLLLRWANKNTECNDIIPLCNGFKEEYEQIKCLYPEQADEWKKIYSALMHLEDKVCFDLKESQNEIDFFFKRNPKTGVFFADVLVTLLGWGYDPIEMDETQLKRVILLVIAFSNQHSFEEEIPTENELEWLMNFLAKSGKNQEDNWKYLVFWENALEYIARIEMILGRMLPRFKENKHLIAPVLRQSVQNWQENIETYCSALGISQDSTNVYLMLSACAGINSQMVELKGELARQLNQMEGQVIVRAGMLLEKTLALQGEPIQSLENICDAMKALSDKKRIELLQLVKQDSLCGQELAKKLELSPATVSHHVNILLSAKMLKIERKGTRLNYCINGDSIDNWMKQLKRCLLE